MTEASGGAGRPRDARSTRRILDATWQAVAERGLAGVDVSAVAERTGCAKSTIYRRWPSRAALIAAAIADGLDTGHDPDTGDVERDLVEFCMVNVTNSTGRLAGLALVAHTDIARELTRTVFDRREQMAVTILERGVALGRLPADIDQTAIVDMLSGFVLFRSSARVATGSSRGHALTREAIAEIVRSIVADPPRRVADPNHPPDATGASR